MKPEQRKHLFDEKKPTFEQKVNILKVEPSALIGIARKLTGVPKKENILTTNLFRNKEFQSFEVKTSRGSKIISSSRKTNVWVIS